MEYNNATLEGRWNLLLKRLLEKTIIKTKQQNLITKKLDLCIKKHKNKIKLASDKT